MAMTVEISYSFFFFLIFFHHAPKHWSHKKNGRKKFLLYSLGSVWQLTHSDGLVCRHTLHDDPDESKFV